MTDIPEDVKHGIVLADLLCELMGRFACAEAPALGAALDEFVKRRQGIKGHDEYVTGLLTAVAKHYLVHELDLVEHMRNAPAG